MDAPNHRPTLAQSLAAHARNRPDALALVAAGRHWTWAELAHETAGRAARLQALLSGPEHLLAVSGSHSELALATLAAYWAGIPLLPLAAHTPGTSAAVLNARHGNALRFTTLDEIDAACCAGETPTPPDLDRHAPSLLIATSGSEGAPKIVVLSAAALAASAEASCTRLGAGAADIWLGCLPLTHIGGQATIARALASGGTLRLHDGFDESAVARDIVDSGTTQVSLVPAMLARLLDVTKAPPPDLRAALLGGAALSASLRRRALAAGWPVWVSYGMSETAAMIAALPPPADASDDWHPGLVGLPLAGTDLAIDEDGRIIVRSAQMMNGYLGSHDSIDGGWFVTGDRGAIDGAGRLTILGRADDMLVTGGTNVHPQAVEAQLSACPGIADVAVTATHDPVWGDVLAALIVGSAEPQAVQQWCRQHLPSPQRPRRFLRVEAIPRNAMGKPDRPALRALLERTAG